jgi:inner membrane protein
MLFRTHILIGIIFFLLLRKFFSGGDEILFFLFVLLGSILPDIDEANSKINRWSGIIGKWVSFFFKHRGIFHSLLFAVLLFIIVAVYWKSYYAWALALGYVAHLIGDGITPMGIQIFYPFSTYKIRGPIRTGGWMEGMVFLVLVVVIIKELL